MFLTQIGSDWIFGSKYKLGENFETQWAANTLFHFDLLGIKKGFDDDVFKW